MAMLTLLPQQEILAVGLDVDGVLRDTGYNAYVGLCKTLVEMKGIVPSFEAFVHGYSHDIVTFFAECGVDKSHDEIFEVYHRYHSLDHHNRNPYADVSVFLKRLQVLGVKAFAISSHPHQQVLEWFATHCLDDYFDHVTGSSIDKQLHLALACKKLDIPPRAVYYVGDWGADMRAAANVHMIPIGITRGYDSGDALIRSGAKYVIDHLEDLTAAIR